MLDLTSREAWERIGTGILILVGGVLLVSMLDFLIFGIAAKCTFTSENKYIRQACRAVHAVFHSMHLLLLFITLWVSIGQVMSEEAASQVFGGLAVGMGFAMQNILKSVVCYFRILLSGEIFEDCELSVNLSGEEKLNGIVLDISIFHVCLSMNKGDLNKGDSKIYISNSKLLDSSFTVKRASNRKCNVITRSNNENTRANNANFGLFRDRNVR